MFQLPNLTIDEILLYLRKSRFDDPTLTVEDVLAKHEEMLEKWVEVNLPGAGAVPESNRYREVVSGETIDSRPAVKEVLRRVESPGIKAFLIVEPQRLSRGDLEDIGKIIKILRYSNTIVITLQYTYDLRDERDRDLFERELKRGNEFLEYQKRILRNGRLLSVSQGHYLGTVAPYGYRKVKLKDGKKTCTTLEPDPDEAPVVRMIFDMYARGVGCSRICDHLDRLAIKPRKGGLWSPDSVLYILSNDHYLGRVHWGKRQEVKTVQGGEVRTSRPVAEEYLVYDGKQDAIVSREVWDAVQAMRGKIPPNNKAGNFSNPLAGLLRCARCGKTLARREYYSHGVEYARPRFTCKTQSRCGVASCLEDELLPEVVAVLREAIDDFEVRIDAGVDDSAEIHRQMVERLERRMTELEEIEASQWEKYTLEGMPKKIFDQLNSKVLAEKAEVHDALCAAKDSTPEPIDLQEKLYSFSAALDALTDPCAPAREKNAFLKACIERIIYERPRGARKAEPGRIELDFTLRV